MVEAAREVDEEGGAGDHAKPDAEVKEEPGPRTSRRSSTFSVGVNGAITHDKPPSQCSTRCRTLLEVLRRGFTDYLLEWRLTDYHEAGQMERMTRDIAKTINGSDVVCFVMPGGMCSYCKMAKDLLLKQQDQVEFSLHVADLLSIERNALLYVLNSRPGTQRMDTVLYPAIFVRGEYLKYEELEALCTSGGFASKVPEADSARKLIAAPTNIELPTASKYPLLLQQAGGGPWLTFQTKIYGNVLRGIAILQICILLPAHMLRKEGNRDVSLPLFALLALDSLLFVCFGPTPLSPLGSLAQAALWRRRGSVVPLVPYKVTFLFYFFASVAVLLCPGEDSNGICENMQTDGLAYTLLTNSIYLAVFRF